MDALLVMKVGNGYLIVPTGQPADLDLKGAEVAARVQRDYSSEPSVCKIIEDYFDKQTGSAEAA